MARLKIGPNPPEPQYVSDRIVGVARLVELHVREARGLARDPYVCERAEIAEEILDIALVSLAGVCVGARAHACARRVALH